MQPSQPVRRRAWLRLLPVALGLMLLAAACAPSTPAPPLATSTPKVRFGIDADGNFYHGDPNAPVKLIEYSDFQ